MKTQLNTLSISDTETVSGGRRQNKPPIDLPKDFGSPRAIDNPALITIAPTPHITLAEYENGGGANFLFS